MSKSALKTKLTCHCEERSDAAIRIPLGLCGVIMRREGTRIPTSGFALSLRLGHASGFQTRAGAGSSIRGAIGRDMHAYRHSSAA